LTTLITSVERPEFLTMFPKLFPDTLGQLFDNLITEFAHPAMTETGRACLQQTEILVALGRRPWAEVVLRGLPASGTDTITLFTRYEMPLAAEQRDAPMTRPQVVFDGALLDRLAAIWVGTQAAAPGPILSTDETAASPAREAAVSGDPPAYADGCPQQAHPRGERDKPQPPSVSRVGHLPLDDTWRVPDGRTNPALATGA
jgi:hypothetical protein